MANMVVIGAGLVGSLLSIFLARRGHTVDVYERLPDFRAMKPTSGRALNLTLCERGCAALDVVGVGDLVRSLSVPVYGRLIHGADGELSYQPYGNRGEAIYSIRRSELNGALLNYAEQVFGVRFHFNQKSSGIDVEEGTIEIRHAQSGEVSYRKAHKIFGSDGAFSAVRQQLQKQTRFNYSQQYWEQGYKELTVPEAAGNGWTSHKNVLHIWPRGNHFLIGFPNPDGSLTCSLHMDFEGSCSFESMRTEADLLSLFRESFPDALPAVRGLLGECFKRPPNSMVSIKCSPWTFGDKVALIGDAAHSILPSYGQGANAGFEDCTVLDECIEKYGDDWSSIFAEYESRRKPNMDAMADLCVEHFNELRDLVGSAHFLLRKRIERKISQLYPEQYRDLYSMITFTRMPYTEALRVNREQISIVDKIARIDAVEERLDSPEVERSIAQLFQTKAMPGRVSA